MKWMIHGILVFSVVAILIVIGCEAKVTSYPTPRTQHSIEINSSFGNRLFIVELDGHRFAVLDFAGRCALCEVTDGSKIKPENP